MSETRIPTPDMIEKLRERSKTGYLNNLINQVTPIKPTNEPEMTEEEYQELISSVFDE